MIVRYHETLQWVNTGKFISSIAYSVAVGDPVSKLLSQSAIQFYYFLVGWCEINDGM